MNPPNPYLEMEVLSAPPEKLQLMLLESAVRKTELAIEQLAEKQVDQADESFVRAQQIVSELMAGLNHEIDPELTRGVLDLYHYIHRNLVTANTDNDIRSAEQALEILRHQRDTWANVVEQMAQARSESNGEDSEDAGFAE